MRKYIIVSFALIFILFGIGSGVTVYHLLSTTSNLRHLISLHEIEDIRQELSFNLQKIQNYTFSSASYFSKNLDEIINNANVAHQTVLRCYECHHEPEIEAELNGVESLFQEYQEQLSYLITTVAEGERRRNYQLKVIDQSSVILNQVQGMVSRASNTLNLKTSIAMRKIKESYIILAVTLVLTFFAALIVAQYLTSRITKPIDELHTAALKIAKGELGYQTSFKGREEFKELISTFNTMSASLAQKEDTIQSTMQKLNQLNLMTLPLHSAHDMSIMHNHLRSSMNTLFGVEHIGFMLPDEDNGNFILHLFDTGTDKTERAPLMLSRASLLHVYKENSGQPLLNNGLQDEGWPFAEQPEGVKLEKLLIVWMLTKNNINGCLLAINKKDEDFSEEDSRILSILANNMSVALENIRLIKDAQQHMLELKNTQRQLIEAEKLTALGTLAGGVAHDFNNILCGMIGYVALLKRNHDPDEKDFKMLDTIEKAGFRAANLTKQLLTFSRQEAMDHRPIEVNQHIENVAKLLENTISKLISIKLELGDPLPQVLSDPAQLEQIVMNLSVNARDAMPSGGQILIQSEKVNVNQKYCEEHPEAKTGDYVKITVSDQGEGIDQEILPRIFEPFFTTKEFGKGTGLGLAMVYGITKSHKGFIIVANAPGKGTSFSVYLPVAGLIEAEEIEPVVSGQMLQANILIVDDEELVASMLAEHLQNLGCFTYHASNGEEALDILKQYKDELDVAILDINMPVMDGSAAFEKMIEIKPDIKVLVASGYIMNSSVKEILDKGAHGFIQKPYSLDNIAAKIRQVMAAS
jgi:signal transduction histidine kinase/ActR/RegA family two-component response regulator/HAMP domain-containing protein